jgi:hypothetical protein
LYSREIDFGLRRYLHIRDSERSTFAAKRLVKRTRDRKRQQKLPA